MRFESRKRRFYEEVEKEFEQRARDIFPLIKEDKISNFSHIVTWEIVKDNPDLPWDWDGLSGNPNITWEIVKSNLDKPWSWVGLSWNPNITWEIVKSNLDKPWNWRGLRNILYREVEDKHGKKYMSAFIIQNRWRNISVDPYHPLGEKVIMNKFSITFQINDLSS
jgi:hypothetical protein